MDTEQFDACAYGMKKTLETLLFETPESVARRKAWMHMQQEFVERNAIFHFLPWNNSTVTLRLIRFNTQSIVPNNLIQKSKADILHISRLADSNGDSAYSCYHEIGECTYLYPTFCMDYSSLGKCISEITASDVYGDLLASTVSPLTPKQQLELIDKKDFTNYHRKYTKRDAYFLRDFILSQGYSVYHYDNRTHKDYRYGPELKKFYRDIVEMQLGFSRKTRAHFQIQLYGTVQAIAKEKIKKCLV
jgi:hypothetical protein